MPCIFMREQVGAYLRGSQHTEGESQEEARAAGLNEEERTFWENRTDLRGTVTTISSLLMTDMQNSDLE